MCCCVGPRFKSGQVYINDNGVLITRSDLSVLNRCSLLFKNTKLLCIKTTEHSVQKTVMNYFRTIYDLSYLLLAREAKVEINPLIKNSLRVGDFLAMQKLAISKKGAPEGQPDCFLGKSLQPYMREKKRRVKLTHETHF